jgi:hypothetical protein
MEKIELQSGSDIDEEMHQAVCNGACPNCPAVIVKVLKKKAFGKGTAGACQIAAFNSDMDQEIQKIGHVSTEIGCANLPKDIPETTPTDPQVREAVIYERSCPSQRHPLFAQMREVHD